MANRIIQDVPTDKPVSQGNVRARLDEEVQAARAKSVSQNGIVVPLIGHYEGDDLILDDGHYRLDAAKRAGLATVPMVIVDHVPTAAERITLQLVANTQQYGLKVMEQARAFHELMQQTNWSAAEVSRRLGGPSPSTISKLLSLLVFPREVQDLVDAGRIPMSSAYAIVTVEDAAERERLIQEVLSGRLTRDRLVEHKRSAGRTTRASQRRPATPRERVVIPLGEERSVAVSAPSLSVESLIAWLTDLVARIRTASADGRPLGEVVKALSVKGR